MAEGTALCQLIVLRKSQRRKEKGDPTAKPLNVLHKVLWGTDLGRQAAECSFFFFFFLCGLAPVLVLPFFLCVHLNTWFL